MTLQDYKVLVLVVTGIVALVVASPALQRLLVFPQSDLFTEFWILGSEHDAASCPFNITSMTNYNVFIAVANHLGNETYYSIQVKFRSQNQSAPNSFNRTPSSLPALFSFNTFVADGETFELPLSFSFTYLHNAALSRVDFANLVLNGNILDLGEYSISQDSEGNGFFGYLFFELWIYDDSAGGFRYHERSTSLRLNMTVLDAL